MEKLYIGIDTGSAYTKGVVVDRYNKIIFSNSVRTNNDSILATKKLIINIKNKIDCNKYILVGIGVTGSSRKLIGSILGAQIIKNEISSIVEGATKLYPGVRTVFEIGENDAKLICIYNGEIVNYEVSKLCLVCSGSIITLISDIYNKNRGNNLVKCQEEIELNNNSTVSLIDSVKKQIKLGYMKSNILLNIDRILAENYVNQIIRDNRLFEPIIFAGGVSKNKVIVKFLENLIDKKIFVDINSEYVEAIGVASLLFGKEQIIDLDDIIAKLNKSNNKKKLVKLK